MTTASVQTVVSGMTPDPIAAGKAQEPWRQNLNNQMMCRDCKEFPPNLIEEFSSGDMVCGSCGLVLGDRIVDTRSEWRTFSNDDQGGDDPSRVGDGANPLLNGSQLQTSISYGDGASNHKSRDLHRAQNKSTHDKSTKALLAAYKEIGALCDALHLMKNVSDIAKHLFKMVNDAGAFKGKSQETIIAGVIFIACRQCNLGRTFREIYALTKVPKAEIGRVFKSLEKFFAKQNKEKMESLLQSGGVVNPNEKYNTTKSTGAKELCERYCSLLRLSFECIKMSQAIAEKVEKIGSLDGRSPISVAAACIYMASALLQDPRTAKDISVQAGVSDGTIRTAYKLIHPEIEKVIDPEWIKSGKVDLKNLPPA